MSGAEAVARAVEAERAVYRDDPAFTWPEAWLAWRITGHAYDEPTAPDAAGWVCVGEVRNRSAARTGYVLVRGEEERVTWVAGG